jgi:cytochrome c peroxidase
MTLRRWDRCWRKLAGIALAASACLWAADFPRPQIPSNNPMSTAKVELGRYLFYEKRMSVNGKKSCGTCHRQDLAFTDGRARAEGTTGELHPRGSMSLVNVAYAPRLTWANPTLDSLEEQALTPMLGEDPVELGLKGRETEFLNVLRGDARYRVLFAAAFPQERDAFTLANVTKAIAAFERTIISMRSPYDRYRFGGDMSAISPAAKRGELLFSSSERGGCFQCHGGWNFSGVRYEGQKNRDGVGEIFFNTGVSDTGMFRAPTLRNIAVTAPYMHDGSIATLEAVLDHYTAGGKVDHPNKSKILRKFDLSPSERADLIEFLKSLTDEELLHDPRWSDPWPK